VAEEVADAVADLRGQILGLADEGAELVLDEVLPGVDQAGHRPAESAAPATHLLQGVDPLLGVDAGQGARLTALQISHA
jgi:hypothetical protein